MRPEEVLQIVEALPPKYGDLRDRHLGDDKRRFVLIFQDNPENWSVRLSIGKTLQHFKWVKVVGEDGSSGPIDTSLTHAIPDEDIQRNVALYFLKKLVIHPAEYANTFRGEKTILLFGLEDQDLYDRARELQGSQADFLRHQVKRAHAITENLLKEMRRLGEVVSAITCCGDLPDLVSEVLERKGISYAVIQPRMTHPSDPKAYADASRGRIPSLQEVVEDPPATVEALPEAEDFPDKQMENMKENARARLIRFITSGDLLRRIEPLVPSSNYESIERIVNSADYGPKTKAVLVKAELMSLLEMQRTQVSLATLSYKASNILDRVGLVGFLATFIGVLLGISMRTWYLVPIILLLGIASLGKLITRRFSDSCGWALFLSGFLGGHYVWGRWGALLGIILAGLVWRFVLPEQGIPRKECRVLSSWKEIEGILMGGTS